MDMRDWLIFLFAMSALATVSNLVNGDNPSQKELNDMGQRVEVLEQKVRGLE